MADFIKRNYEEWSSDIFMVDDAGEEINAVEGCFPDSSVFLCHFHVLRSWRKKLCHKHGANIDSHKVIVWNDLWHLLKTEGLTTLSVGGCQSIISGWFVLEK